MRYLALATDYDGTLAHDGRVSEEALDALRRLKESGRKLLLVSGRQLPELQDVFPEFAIFDLIVAENGALLYDPKTRTETPLCDPPPPRLAEELRARGVAPLAEGRVILATWTPHETKVFETIRDLGLEMQVIFNKGAVMILPSGVNKASGLKIALESMGLSPHNVVAVGDAENDHALLQLGECGVAMSNALASLKENADLVTQADHGRGVAELIERLLQDDLANLAPKLKRHDLKIGHIDGDKAVRVPAYGTSVLIAGTSGGGKSTLAASFIERLTEQNYQYCLIDPEGDHAEMPNAVVLGDTKHAPGQDEVLTALAKPTQNCVVNLVGIKLEERPESFQKMLARLIQLRTDTGRPHWIILDEAHHILPISREELICSMSVSPTGMLYITVEPEHIARCILEDVDLILAIGSDPRHTISAFTCALGEHLPTLEDRPLARGETMAWWRQPRGVPFVFQSIAPSLPRHRHIRKYAEGDMKENTFIFTGPDNRLKLRAQNLFIFLQMGEGVDDLTWDWHLRAGDYERWFRDCVKDDKLAAAAASIAQDMAASPDQTRQFIRQAVEERYTAPK
jgi:phosphoglycolate phosphatase (TIGR01487 family)